MYSIILILTYLEAMLSVKKQLDFESEEQCTEEEYHEGLYELILDAIHQYHGIDCMNDIKQSRISFGTALKIVKAWGYRYHEYEV
jgi:hypothetical protein